jgi:hypothetical protein
MCLTYTYPYKWAIEPHKLALKHTEPIIVWILAPNVGNSVYIYIINLIYIYNIHIYIVKPHSTGIG